MEMYGGGVLRRYMVGVHDKGMRGGKRWRRIVCVYMVEVYCEGVWWRFMIMV